MASETSYSADIEIYLVIDGARYEVAGCLQNECTLRVPVDHPPCNAELTIIVDGKNILRKIFLPQGLSIQSKTARFEIIQ